ncbi:MAG: hypothetical protein WBO76_17300 [Saprospiraceae bacterium]
MHFLLSYQVDVQGDKCDIIHTDIQNVLSKYNKVKLFGETYIIQIRKVTEWEDIREGLSQITEQSGCDCKFIMTPIVQGGYYNGWLENNKWKQIEELITSKS